MGRKTGKRTSGRNTVRTLLVLFVVGTGLTLLSWVMLRTWDWETLALNLGTELVGVALTYLLLARWVGEEEQEEERTGIAGMGSEAKEVAVDAAGQVRKLLFGRAIKSLFPKKRFRS